MWPPNERAVREGPCDGVAFIIGYSSCGVEVAQGPAVVVDSWSVWLWHFPCLASDRDAIPSTKNHRLKLRKLKKEQPSLSAPFVDPEKVIYRQSPCTAAKNIGSLG